ncbi:MAG: noncanonical pyrimidine nucleotidase, YjjG family [Bacteroidetes bacterium]|nr:noncanonical pyrimidine nucleotidase, YjjG family [Bacteroidota bacterium]
MKKHSHIFFDLDHTLWDTDRNAEESLREIFIDQQLKEKGIPDFEQFHICYKNHNERLWGLYAENKVGKDAVRVHRFLNTLQDFQIHDPNIAHQIADHFVERTPNRKHLIPGALELLDQLHGNYHLSIITNGFKEAQHIKLKASGLDKYFDTVFISEEVGVHKPDPKIFNHAVKQAGAVHVSDCMMIGDTYQTDVFGALNAGMTAVHFAPGIEKSHELPVITIRQLNEILEHLGS